MLHPKKTRRTTRAIEHALEQSKPGYGVVYYVKITESRDCIINHFRKARSCFVDNYYNSYIPGSVIKIISNNKKIMRIREPGVQIFGDNILEFINECFSFNSHPNNIIFIDHSIIEDYVESVYYPMINTIVNDIKESEQEYLINEFTIELNNRLLNYIWDSSNFYKLHGYINHIKFRINYLVQKSKEHRGYIHK